ncbi:hypothetical protein DNTS_001328 [Danionella cerebrum]|uniref:Protein kinase domain-containing protein n=1 Tax=Danionella cerebrum TaxID=2873325 RepID=A0A553Q3S9_9TELE|nr:hypothetical protein DNTS_001328 [Danionella translucida]
MMDQSDYLVDAAQQIRMALDREINEDYEAAFSYYKNGVDLLLNGVQVDPNKERREAGYSSLRFRSIRHLSSPVDNLSMCRVTGVLTVESLISKETFIIKSLPKSSWESRERSTVIPQGGRLFSRLHRVREHPECFSPNPLKVFLMNSYNSPPGSPADHCVESVRPLSSHRKDTEDYPLSGLLQNRKGSPQDPLPIRPCVIVDTRDPFDVSSDLLGNNVCFEWIDSSVDFYKALNASDPAQDHPSFTFPASNSDILGFRSTAQVTPSSLFGDAQPKLCSTVNVLPQRVRIISNRSHLPPSNPSVGRRKTHLKSTQNGRVSQFVARLSKTSSDRKPQNQEGISLELNTLHVEREVRNLQIESCRFVSTSSQKQQGLGSASKRNRQGLPENEVRLWGAQMLLALESLHEQGIVCQDLNPRNILLHSNGEVCLTYFGQWTEVQLEINPRAMKEMYCAPEIGGVSKITEACDWWSLGALLYELLTGMPLWQCHPAGVHPHTPLHIPDFLSTAATSLLSQLLQFEACSRLGCGAGGVSDIKCHPFFSTVSWADISSS